MVDLLEAGNNSILINKVGAVMKLDDLVAIFPSSTNMRLSAKFMVDGDPDKIISYKSVFFLEPAIDQRKEQPATPPYFRGRPEFDTLPMEQVEPKGAPGENFTTRRVNVGDYRLVTD
ncbi:hypothetical protein LXL04_039812 [Taraxacum kok-saghyz]